MFDREVLTENGKATFYATVWPSLIKVAADNGWALGLHGSLQSDMDIMAMPWTEEANSAEDLINDINDLIGHDACKEINLEPFYGKPNNRVGFTLFAFLAANVLGYKYHTNGGKW